MNMNCNMMSLACSAIHKKPVCNKCDAGTNCTKYCLCQPHTGGRPRKAMALSCSEPQRLNEQEEECEHEQKRGEQEEECEQEGGEQEGGW